MRLAGLPENLTAGFLNNNRSLYPVPALLLLLAFWLRIDDVGQWPVNWDETFSVWLAHMDLATSTARTAGDVHPPLHYWLFHLWVRLTGISEFAIRTQSVFFSTITAAVVYNLTLRLGRQPMAAVLAMVLLTLSAYHITWSHDARMYSMATMFAALAVYACVRGAWRLFAIAGIGAMLTHYYGVIVIGILVLHRFIYWRAIRHGRRQFVVAVAAMVVACLPWAVYAWGLIRRDASTATFDPQYVFQRMAQLYVTGKAPEADNWIVPVALVTALFFAGLALNWRHQRRNTVLVVLGCLVPPLLIALLGLPFIPVHVNALSDRHLLLFSPFIFAGWGLGLVAIWRQPRLRRAGLVAGTLLLLFNGALAAEKRDGRYFRDDFRSMMAAVAALTTAEDKVFFISGGRSPVVYYHLEQVGYDVPRDQNAVMLNVTGIPESVADVPAMMAWVFAGFPRFWLIEIEAHLDWPLNARIDWINEHYHRIYHIPLGYNGISYYSRDENEELPDIQTVVPPVIREARPNDQVRIGVPADTTVDLVHAGKTMDSRRADAWQLLSFDIYPHYPNGEYTLRVADDSYSFVVTHSQAASR